MTGTRRCRWFGHDWGRWFGDQFVRPDIATHGTTLVCKRCDKVHRIPLIYDGPRVVVTKHEEPE